MAWPVRVVLIVAGASLFGATVHAILANMLVPRPRSTVIGALATMPSRALFRWLAFRQRTFRQRDSILAASGPVTVLMQLLVFVLCFLAGAGLMVYGFTGHGVATAFYQAGSSLFTLGIVEPANGASVVVGLVSAFVGLVVVAILVGYLLTLYQAYTSRESTVARLGLLAGEPAWGPEFLCRAHLLGFGQREPIYESWLEWTSAVRLNHSLYPVLNQFRSSQPHRHWLVSMVAVLDAAALELTVLRHPSERATLVRLLAEGTETLSALRAAGSAYFTPRRNRLRQAPPTPGTPGIFRPEDPRAMAVITAISGDAQASMIGPYAAEAARHHTDPGITRAEWDRAYNLLRTAGANPREDQDKAWQDFRTARAMYAANANAVAQEVYATPGPWTGPRHPQVDVIWPNLASEHLP